MKKFWSTSITLDDSLQKEVFKFAKRHKIGNMAATYRVLIQRGLDQVAKNEAVMNTEELLRINRMMQDHLVDVYVEMMARIKDPETRAAIAEKRKSIIALFDKSEDTGK